MIELSGAQYKAKREELLRILTPKEAAIFRFVEHLSSLEQQTRSETDPELHISWNAGRTTEFILKEALNGNTFFLPFPRGPAGSYHCLGWYTEYPYSHYDKSKYPSMKEYRDTFPTKGCRDIRILDMIYSQTPHLYFTANTGSFKKMEEDWAQAFDNEPYPVVVDDRYGFRYTNPAYQRVSEPKTS